MLQQIIIIGFKWFNKLQALAWWLLCLIVDLLEKLLHLAIKLIGTKVLGIIFAGYLALTGAFIYAVNTYEITLSRVVNASIVDAKIAYHTKDLWLK